MIFTDIHRTPQGDPQVRPISRRSGTKYLFCGWSWGWIKYSSISFDYIRSYYIKWPILIINFITCLLETYFQYEIGKSYAMTYELMINKWSIKMWIEAPFKISFRTYYHYSGSLTTPPCNEGARWFVSSDISFVTEKQLDVFRFAIR